jgi:hypothetical protein
LPRNELNARSRITGVKAQAAQLPANNSISHRPATPASGGPRVSARFADPGCNQQHLNLGVLQFMIVPAAVLTDR